MNIYLIRDGLQQNQLWGIATSEAVAYKMISVFIKLIDGSTQDDFIIEPLEIEQNHGYNRDDVQTDEISAIQ